MSLNKDFEDLLHLFNSGHARVYQALKKFGAPVKNLTIGDLTNPNLVFQIGIQPNRIDLLMGIKGLSFDQAWKRRRLSRYGKEKAYFLDRKDLIRAKKRAARPQDRIDLQLLSQKVIWRGRSI